MSKASPVDSRPEASLEEGTVRFASASALERGVRGVVDRGLLDVVTAVLPKTPQSFRFAVYLPGPARLELSGRVKSVRGPLLTIEVTGGRDDLARAWMAARKQAARAERRHNGRRPITHAVRLGEEQCITRDASPTGMCLATDQIIAVGTLVMGLVQVGGEWVPFEGEVRWCKLKRPGSSERGSLGVRFTAVGDDYQLLFVRGGSARTNSDEVPVTSPPSAAAAAGATASVPRMTPATPMPAASSARTRPTTDPGMQAVRQSERRRRKRVRRRFKVNIGASTGFVFDVSNEGLCVELSKVLVPGSDVSGVVHLPDGPVTFMGQVRWARAANPNLGMLGRMGVLLRDPPAALVAIAAQG